MKKKKITLIIIGVLVVAILIIVIQTIMYRAQYNSKGISHYLTVTINRRQEKEYVGKFDTCEVFVEGFNIHDIYFINVKDEHISLQDALDKKLVTKDEWKKYANKVKKIGTQEILKYDNYEIVYDNYMCLIRPLTR